MRVLESGRMRPLFVIDIETTDLDPDKGEIVEVGIARVDLFGRKVYPEYSKIVHQFEIGSDAWVFNNSSLSVKDVTRSPWLQSDIRLDLIFYQKIGVFTSYNQPFDFGWLDKKLGLEFRTVSDIMDICTEIQGRRTSAQSCYLSFCQDNPANLDDMKEEHRALSDAVMESYILLAVCEENPTIRHGIQNRLMRD